MSLYIPCLDQICWSPSPCPVISRSFLVDLLLLVQTELTRATVDQEKKTTNDGENLEEVVLGKVLVGVVLMKLKIQTLATMTLFESHR